MARLEAALLGNEVRRQRDLDLVIGRARVRVRYRYFCERPTGAAS
jgi:hypothetical protein